MKTYKNLASVIRSVVTEAHKKDDPPFDGPYIKSKGNVKDKSGAIHTPMSRAKDLARKAMQQLLQRKMKESFDLDITDEEADDLLESIQEISKGE